MNTFLSQNEADELINMLKECVDKIIHIPVQGTSNKFLVKSIASSEHFDIVLSRKNRRVNKYSILALYNKDILLLRLDMGPTAPHENPDTNEKILGAHLHIYREGIGAKFAIPVDDPIDGWEKSLSYLLNKFFVQDTPAIQYKIGESIC